MGTSAGSIQGSIVAMYSYTLDITDAGLSFDVHLPSQGIAHPGGTKHYLPGVAQITTNLFQNQSSNAATVFSVLSGNPQVDSDFFTNCVYAADMARVTFGCISTPAEGFAGDTGGGIPWCMALANVFLFAEGSSIVPTPLPPPARGGGGGGFR
jgi:hypothetical protein